MSKHMTSSWPLTSPERSKAPSYELGKQTKSASHGSISKKFRSARSNLEPLPPHLPHSMDLKPNGPCKKKKKKVGAD